MFIPSKLKPTKPQKRSSWSMSSSGMFKAQRLNYWPGVFALSAGYMAVRLVEYIYMWLKKALKYPTSLVRFWVNLQASIQVTSKPENVRMGKGKGSSKGMRAFVHAGSFLFKVTSVSKGLLSFFFKKLQVSVPFSLGVYLGLEFLGFYGTPYTWMQQRMVQKKYLVKQFEVYKGLLKKMHSPLILGYLYRMFWWRFLIPYAIWSPVSLTTPKVSLKRKYLRRRKMFNYVKPQSAGFIRQMSLKFKQYLTLKQKFNQPMWRKLQISWVYRVKSVNIFSYTPNLPWDILLKAKRFKRILIYMNFMSFLPLVQSFLSSSLNIWLPLKLQPGELIPASLKTMTAAQMRIAMILGYWRSLMSSPMNLNTLL